MPHPRHKMSFKKYCNNNIKVHRRQNPWMPCGKVYPNVPCSFCPIWGNTNKEGRHGLYRKMTKKMIQSVTNMETIEKSPSRMQEPLRPCIRLAPAVCRHVPCGSPYSGVPPWVQPSRRGVPRQPRISAVVRGRGRIHEQDNPCRFVGKGYPRRCIQTDGQSGRFTTG